MNSRNTIARRLMSADGAEIAEAALVLPLVFMLLLGIVWFGRAFNIYSTITQAAQQGATTAARSSCATCGNIGASDAAVDTVVTGVMQSSNLDPSQIPATPSPGLTACPSTPPGACTAAGDNIWVCRNVLLNPPLSASQPPQCGAVVTFQYPFKFYLPFTSLNMQQIVMSAQAQQDGGLNGALRYS